jgi:hypothetical protein
LSELTGKVGVHVAVAGVHVQGHEDPSPQDLVVDRLERLHQRLEVAPAEDVAQGIAQLRLPRDAHLVQLHALEHGGLRIAPDRRRVHAESLEVGAHVRRQRVEVGEDEFPAIGHPLQQQQRLLGTVAEERGAIDLGIGVQRQLAREELRQARGELQLVGNRELDVDALDAVGVLAQLVERDHHVLVDLEGIGVPGDGGGARAVEPEALPLLWRHGHEALAVARVGDAHHVRGRLAHRVLVVAHDVGDEDHARAPTALRLGGIADRLHVALVQVLEPGEDRLRMRVEVALDLDDGGHGLLHVPEELQAHGAHVLRHPVKDEGGRCDEPVAAFLLHARQAPEELVRHVLAEAFLAQALALDLERFLALQRAPVGGEAPDAEARHRLVVDAAAVVVEALDLEPVGLGGHHAPRSEVVERRAPEHRLLAAGIHRDVAADARGIRRGGVDREDQPLLLRGLHHALGDDARAAADHGALLDEPRQHAFLDRLATIELLGVDDRGEAIQRDGAAGVSGAAAARDDREAQVDQRLHDRRALLLGVGVHHHEGILDAPVSGVGHVRDARHAVELDVVPARDRHQAPGHLAPQLARLGELGFEGVHGLARGREQLPHLRVALGVGLVGAALVDLAQAVAHRLDEEGEAPRAVEQVVLQVRIAPHHPDVAQDLVEHPRRAAGHALRAQLVQRVPRLLAQQPDHDLAIREGGVVVGNLAEARGHGESESTALQQSGPTLEQGCHLSDHEVAREFPGRHRQRRRGPGHAQPPGGGAQRVAGERHPRGEQRPAAVTADHCRDPRRGRVGARARGGRAHRW